MYHILYGLFWDVGSIEYFRDSYTELMYNNQSC